MGNWLSWLEERLGGGPGGKKRISAFRWLMLLGLVGVMFMILNSFLSVKTINRDQLGLSKSSPDTGAAGPPNKTDATGAMAMPSSGKGDPFRDYEMSYDASLKSILEKIVGVGQVDVMVTIDSTEEVVVDHSTKNTQETTSETDQSGGKRRITSVSKEGQVSLYQVSGGTSPIIIKKIQPKIRGVLIVARGAENPTVKKLLTEAVQRGLDVPAYRISVIPRKTN